MIAATDRKNAADEHFGYPFGVDGVCSLETAKSLLDCHHATLYRLVKRGILRHGHLGGRARFCRRSINDYLKSLEA